MKPTLKTYWEANSSTERVEIIESAFTYIDQLESSLQDAVIGLEWRRDHGVLFDKADQEKLTDWKKLLKQ